VRRSGVAINFKLLRSLRSPLTRRLFELVNLLADEGKRDFDFNLNELAHEHLGLSQKITAPSQVWGKIEPSFSTLSERGILDSYELIKPSLRVIGCIGSKYVPQPRIASIATTNKEDVSQPSLPLDGDAAKCPDCQGTGYWYPGGQAKGVAKCKHLKLSGRGN
jgi:hypothetical protein